MATKALVRRTNGFPSLFNDLMGPWDSFFSDENRVNNLLSGRIMNIPSVNVVEKAQSYEISVAAPGLKKEDFNIDVQGDMLTISVQQQGEKEEKEDRYTRQEFNYASFSRSFSLPEWAVKDKIDARYQDGLLIVEIPTTDHKKSQLSKHVPVK